MPTYSYDDIREVFKEKKCELKTTAIEFSKQNETVMASKCRIEFIASCGHDNTVTLTNFISKSSGVICKDCSRKNVGEILRNKYDHTDGCLWNIQEAEGFQKICDLVEDEFDIIRSNEGCLGDILIKPKYITDDKWVLIQLKCTKQMCHKLYSFSFNKEQVYENIPILLVCISNSMFWLLDYTQVLYKSQINIGLTSKSEYYQYQIESSCLQEKMHVLYAKSMKFNEVVGLLPQSLNQQQEMFYRRHRENNISYLEYDYPLAEGRVYDFIINKKYRIQEKVASLRGDRVIESYLVSINRKGRCNKYRLYKKGDNDYYLIWLKNDLNTFYLFPESALIERNYINCGEEEIYRRPFMSITYNNWTTEFLYNLTDLNLKNKLLDLFP